VQEAREVHDAVVAALGDLPAHERQAAIGFFLEGYSYAELAELLGVPVSTVKGRLFKGRRRLQRALGPLAADALRPDHKPRKELPVSENTLIEVTIESIRKALLTPHQVVVLREKAGGRDLPIWIGSYEGDVLARALDGQQTERPMTHEMALRLLAPLGAQVRQVAVSKLVENTFYAEITLTVGETQHVVDARPSDALVLAARSGAPIFAAREVLEQAGIAVEANPEHKLTVGPADVEQPSPFRVATWRYLGDLALAEPGAYDWEKMAAVDWDARFPTREVEIDGQPLLAARLSDGDDGAWLATRPELWQDVTTMAQRLIALAEEVRDGMRQGR
jgi:bifunctional DNase/RNase